MNADARLNPAEAEEPALACDLGAIAPDQLLVHLARTERLLGSAALERQELEDGFGFRFAAAEYAEVAAYIADERRCCPFLTFALEVGPERGPLWLRITGAPAVKDFLRSELAAHLRSAG